MGSSESLQCRESSIPNEEPMKLGMVIRTMGPQSTRDTILRCATAAESAGIDEVWVPDHIAIAPDNSEGSGGRYLDPLAVLAFLAGTTQRIGLATGVLVLPYRPPLPTAKWVATIQELCSGRLSLGVGVGWLASEFAALGIDRSLRGRSTDETLDLLLRCFATDEVEAHGQKFLFRPRPARPPIFIGGTAPHALERAVRYGDGWIPMGGDPARLAAPILELRELADRADKPSPEVVLMTGFDLSEPSRAADQAHALASVGVTHFVHGSRYSDADAFRADADALAEHLLPELAEL
jgi:probable F420-dependent oxidoreductase